MKFGERLRLLRKKKGLTQDQVAESISVSRRAYIAYEQDNVRPRKQDTYNKLAKVLGCDVNYLMVDDYPARLKTSVAMASALGALLMPPLNLIPLAWILSKNYLGLKNSYEKSDMNVDEPEESEVLPIDVIRQSEMAQKKFAAMAMGILYKAAAEKGIHCQTGIITDLSKEVIKPDEFIIVANHEITSWWLVFWAKDPNLDDTPIITLKEKACLMISRFTTAKSDPRRMASIVVEDNDLYDAVCTFKGRTSYRGNLSVILVDTNEVAILKEEIISVYAEECDDQNAYITLT